MANSGPGPNASVEEILASIRQAISEDDARRIDTRRRPEPRAMAQRHPVASVSAVFDEGSDEQADHQDDEESSATVDADGDEGFDDQDGPDTDDESGTNDVPDTNEESPAADIEIEAEPSPSEPSIDQGVIELAIEQALDGVRAELEGRKAPRPRLRQELVRAPQRPIPRPPRLAAPRRDVPPPPRRALLSAGTDAEVSASFDELAKAMIEGNAPKLNEVVEDILRPMLKTWLEGNLPQMVERMVREEIERVARGRR